MKLIFEQIKKYVISILLLILIGIAVYGVFHIQIKNENFQFQFQNQSQNQSQMTAIVNGVYMQGMRFESIIITPEICDIKEPSNWFISKDPEEEEVKAYADCIMYKFESKPFGYAVTPIYKRSNKLPWFLVTYWDFKR
jgi:hypothetical protein